MNILGTTRTAWQILKCSVSVMLKHKKLLIFPVVITFFTVLAALLFISPIVLQPTGHRLNQSEHWKAVGSSVYSEKTMQSVSKREEDPVVRFQPKFAMYLALLYFVSMFLATFMNVAFSSQIIQCLRGGQVSIRGGLRFAAQRWQSIFLWSVLAGFVGYIISKLSENFDVVGRFVMNLIGLGWSVAAIFAVPVLVVEESTRNPLIVLRRSAAVIRKTWGETLVGYIGLSLGSMVLIVTAFVLLCPTVILSINLQTPWPAVMGLFVWLSSCFAIGYLSSIANHIYKCCLYLYAATGTIPAPFERSMMDFAWKKK